MIFSIAVGNTQKSEGVLTKKAAPIESYKLPVTHIKYEQLQLDFDKTLGRGAFREVEYGEWLCTLVAVKFIDYIHGFKDKSFIRELSVLSGLKHDNITQVRA